MKKNQPRLSKMVQVLAGSPHKNGVHLSLKMQIWVWKELGTP